MIGFALIRRSGENWRLSTVLLVLFLALLASIKFTNLILASSSRTDCLCAELFRGRWHIALRLASCFLAGFLALWIVCGQSIDNLPTYLYNSWHSARATNRRWGSPPGPAVLARRDSTGCALGIRIAVSHTAFCANPAHCLAWSYWRRLCISSGSRVSCVPMGTCSFFLSAPSCPPLPFQPCSTTLFVDAGLRSCCWCVRASCACWAYTARAYTSDGLT